MSESRLEPLCKAFLQFDTEAPSLPPLRKNRSFAGFVPFMLLPRCSHDDEKAGSQELVPEAKGYLDLATASWPDTDDESEDPSASPGRMPDFGLAGVDGSPGSYAPLCATSPAATWGSPPLSNSSVLSDPASPLSTTDSTTPSSPLQGSASSLRSMWPAASCGPPPHFLAGAVVESTSLQITCGLSEPLSPLESLDMSLCTATPAAPRRPPGRFAGGAGTEPALLLDSSAVPLCIALPATTLGPPGCFAGGTGAEPASPLSSCGMAVPPSPVHVAPVPSVGVSALHLMEHLPLTSDVRVPAPLPPPALPAWCCTPELSAVAMGMPELSGGMSPMKQTRSSPGASEGVCQVHGRSQAAAVSRRCSRSQAGPAPQLHDGLTTLTVRNLAVEFTTQSLVTELCRAGFAEQFDFCYVPCHFSTCQGKGFGFVNFTSSEAAERCVRAWHGARQFGGVDLPLQLNVAAAEVQGREANVKKWAGPQKRRIRNPVLRPFIGEPI